MSEVVREEVGGLVWTAASWWADRLREQLFDAKPLDNGDPVGSSLGTIVAQAVSDEYGEEHIDRFRDALALRLHHLVSETYDAPRHVIAVDYGPDPILRECAEDAGIAVRTGVFPWKTIMGLYPDRGLVEVKVGYGAAWDTLDLL